MRGQKLPIPFDKATKKGCADPFPIEVAIEIP